MLQSCDTSKGAIDSKDWVLYTVHVCSIGIFVARVIVGIPAGQTPSHAMRDLIRSTGNFQSVRALRKPVRRETSFSVIRYVILYASQYYYSETYVE